MDNGYVTGLVAGFFLGALSALCMAAGLNTAEFISRWRRNRKQRIEDVSDFRRISYIALSSHNEESEVDRLLSLKK